MTIFSHFHWRSEELGAVFSFWYCVSQLWDKKPVFQQSQFCLCEFQTCPLQSRAVVPFPCPECSARSGCPVLPWHSSLALLQLQGWRAAPWLHLNCSESWRGLIKGHYCVWNYCVCNATGAAAAEFLHQQHSWGAALCAPGGNVELLQASVRRGVLWNTSELHLSPCASVQSRNLRCSPQVFAGFHCLPGWHEVFT